jgi:hypothetical protein
MTSWKKTFLRKVYISLYLKKAFDTVPRGLLFAILKEKAQTPEELHLVNLIKTLFTESTLMFGDKEIKCTKGVQQGSVLAPLLFNLLLVHVLNKIPKLKEAMIALGKLIAFADDFLLIGDDKKRCRRINRSSQETISLRFEPQP